MQGHCFGGAGYVGVGVPQFYYADMTALTLGKIGRMLGLTVKLPPPIDHTGFPEGAAVSMMSIYVIDMCICNDRRVIVQRLHTSTSGEL